MTLKEAYEKANSEDIITGGLSELQWSKKEILLKSESLTFISAMMDNWEIIPAKPKVLTAGEFWATGIMSAMTSPNTESIKKETVFNIFKAGEKNKLIELSELIESVKEFMNASGLDVNKYDRMASAIRNLKG